MVVMDNGLHTPLAPKHVEVEVNQEAENAIVQHLNTTVVHVVVLQPNQQLATRMGVQVS